MAGAAGTLTIRASVVDGDTLELADGNRVRIWGIDAVENAQVCHRDGRPWRCGDDATAALRRLIDGQKVACEARDVDRYGRMIAVCLVDGADIGSEMVRQGWALDYERYSGGAYADEQKAAWSSGRAYGRASSSRLGNGAGHGDGSRQR
jgi:endonuclease YncB( thermonuclease family)